MHQCPRDLITPNLSPPPPPPPPPVHILKRACKGRAFRALDWALTVTQLLQYAVSFISCAKRAKILAGSASRSCLFWLILAMWLTSNS